ncbi:MAG: T9SS type A sorting domain-containing protein, partial [Crocinitomicaceae bacterium]|nr:T9SS type A sorting domain-containing protein [Crocinitomicaceae bacterium]
VVTLNLIIDSVDTTVTPSGLLLTANQSGASYQWLDCPAMTPISGAVGQSYTATANGDYAVIINHNGCTDTSECYTVNSVGIVENDFETDVLIYPNPTDGNFSIDLGGVYETINVTIRDAGGKLIQSKTYTSSQILKLKLDEAPGIYAVVIASDSKRAVVKLSKE